MLGKVNLYFHTALEALNEKIDRIITNYTPENLSIPGTATFDGNVVLGSAESNTLTVNSQTTFNGDVNANEVNINRLTAIDNTTIGQNSDDLLTVNAVTTFTNLSSVTCNGRFDANGNTTLNGSVTLNGSATLNGNVALGSDDSDILTVNSQTTFNADVTATVVNINALTALDNTTIGQDHEDLLTVNAATTFTDLSGVTFNGGFDVNGNATFGTDTTNTISSTGRVTAPHFYIPTTSGNSVNIATRDTIVYREYNASANIYTDYPHSVIVIIKNTLSGGGSTRLITYDSVPNTVNIAGGETQTWIRMSPTAFTKVITYSPS